MNLKSEALYFRDIKRYRVLDEQEERELIKQVQEGDAAAIEKLVTANLRFVVSIAQRYRGRGLSYLELINEGNIGLLKAAKRFNPENKVKFISYAVWWIRQTIQKALFEQTGTVRIPPNKIALLNKFRQTLERKKGDYLGTIEEEEFRGREAEIVEVMERMHGLSLDAPLAGMRQEDDSAKTLQDVLGEDPRQDTESLREELNTALDSVLQCVSSREERILRMYYGLNFAKQFTLEEIGRELKLTRERVRMIRDKSLRKLLQNPASREVLGPFLESSFLL
ncbi:MAG: RNA polymerase sigma factor RpoD/SigA [Chitinispirillales bacterium]|jgi:RNA polymerase primary sigma factor|nr:RNA polymerase sigma factor RpoD/SigA [Chitinispirillales bacterium]